MKRLLLLALTLTSCNTAPHPATLLKGHWMDINIRQGEEGLVCNSTGEILGKVQNIGNEWWAESFPAIYSSYASKEEAERAVEKATKSRCEP